jgi:N-acetyl-gamma-glutamyl-phosphate reductase
MGAELMRLCAGHPDIDVVVAQSESSAGEPVGALYPGLAGAYDGLAYSGTDPAQLEGLDAAFLALGAGEAQKLVPQLRDSVPHVIDLSADFRLRDEEAYPEWYGFRHEAPELLAEAVYGLPELNRPALRGAALVAAPGCYVTAASLALAPLAVEGAIETAGVVVNAASGVTGAGRRLSDSTHFAAVNEGMSAYGLVSHRHTPEIEQVTGCQVLFTPHLAPMSRGILATCYARATDMVTSTDAVLDVLREAYTGERFVRVVDESPSTRSTLGSNCCHITARFDPRTGYVIVISALDNLVKGGAGQALQAANLALDLPEELGLPAAAVVP